MVPIEPKDGTSAGVDMMDFPVPLSARCYRVREAEVHYFIGLLGDRQAQCLPPWAGADREGNGCQVLSRVTNFNNLRQVASYAIC